MDNSWQFTTGTTISGSKAEGYSKSTDSADVSNYKERFSEDNVKGSFSYLLNKFGTLWSTVNFFELKKICERDNRLSNELRTSISNANDLENTFAVLSSSPYCTWLELRILKRMAKVADVPEATDMINTFEECIHHRKCSEVAVYFEKEHINPDHLTLVEAKLNRNVDSFIVSDLFKYCHKLESVCKLPPESSALVSTEKGCRKICFCIPTYCSFYAYEIIKSDFWRLRPIHIQYLQIGTFTRIYAIGNQRINNNESFLKWISSFDSFSSHTEVISYYYPYLLHNMDADSVSHMMHCNHLITDDDYEAITAAPNDWMMNVLILEYIRKMDLPALLKFASLLKTIETQESIGCSLKKALTLVDQNSTETWSVDTANFKNYEDELMETHNLKLQLMFLDLIYKLTKLMSTVDLVMLVNSLMASVVDQVLKLNIKVNPFLFRVYLLPFVSWFDHSILKELVESSKSREAIELVHQFDSCIDYNQPITSCIPEFSHLTIPWKESDSDYTLLVTKLFKRSCNEIVLQDLLNVKEDLTSKWRISYHAFHLVAMHHKLNYFYWMIPTYPSLEEMINQDKQVLWDIGIINVAILPHSHLSDQVSQPSIGYKINLLSFNVMEDATEEYLRYMCAKNAELANKNQMDNEITAVASQDLKTDLKEDGKDKVIIN